ncbi:MAG: hypothetical protein N2114_05400 [Candidatus Goldbacteria bacterium]|nr:hypothetical protein [Candidatus Goldiibacteriota bacterium]
MEPIRVKKYIIVFLFIFISFCSHADTTVSGIIDKKESWTPANSPYIISGNVTIEKNGIVLVNPGTVIKFKKDGKITVKGIFYVKGNINNPIRFLPEDGESFYEGIKYESKYKNIIEYSIFIRGTIIVEGSVVEISNNYILNSTGIELFHFANAVIKDNYFYNNTYGVYIDGEKTQYSIIQNTFNKNRFAIYIKRSDLELIAKNNFFNNTVNITNYEIKDIQCKENFWGVVDEKSIQSFIFDKKNNPKVGNVIFIPFYKDKLNLPDPPPSFVSLVKIYLSLKRPDEQPGKFGFSAGFSGFKPFIPDTFKNQADYGTSLEAEFLLSLTGAFVLGLEGKILNLTNKDKTEYDYSYNSTSIFLNCYGYLGYQPNVFFIPYMKIGNGVSLLSEQYKYVAEKTKKINEIDYTVLGAIGCEIYPLKFFSIRIEPSYNYTVSSRGNISKLIISAKGTIYFNSPFVLNN